MLSICMGLETLPGGLWSAVTRLYGISSVHGAQEVIMTFFEAWRHNPCLTRSCAD